MTTVPDARTAELASGLEATRRRIDAAAAAAGRASDEITLLVVTKYFPAEDMMRLLELGERQFGESREPEASRKVTHVRSTVETDFAADMIGRVQRKKAGSIARWARRVHSVDSLPLIEAFDGAAERALDAGHRSAPLGVLLQVSLDGDPDRGGLLEAALAEAADRVLAASETLTLDGLMVIAPPSMAPAAAMGQIAQVRARFVEHCPAATVLSAGMSADMDEAIANGSTCVRVGTAIMGSRPILSL